jgi:hypothetical protein
MEMSFREKVLFNAAQQQKKALIHPALKWNATTGVLSYSVFHSCKGKRVVTGIELGSQQAEWTLDLATRQHGCGKAGEGFYDLKLVPVACSMPDWPDDSYKSAIGCWLYNPFFGEARMESFSTTLVKATVAVWDRCRTIEEAAEGWVVRDQIPALAVRPPTSLPAKRAARPKPSPLDDLNDDITW